MPRTLPAALTTVMDTGIYEPYLKVVVSEDLVDINTVDPLAFTLEALQATVKIAKFSEDNAAYLYFRIVRGAIVSGTPSTISSVWFVTERTIFDGKFVTLTGKVLPPSYLSIAADSTYQEVIEDAITANGAFTSAVTYEGTATWKTYQFYPTGKSIVLNGLMKLFTLLKQKYLVFATENGWDGVNNNYFFFCATDARAQDYTFIDLLFSIDYKLAFRKLIWRDEANTVHTNGSGTSPLHNLGFLHSTASAPPNTNGSYIGSHSSKIPVHLKYRTGDYVSNTNTGLNAFTGRINVIEVLDLQTTPSWHMVLEKLVWFGGTEGGPLPSTIEAAAPYTPLATGNFDGTLSVNDNNLQAAMETIDDHEHAAYNWTQEEIEDLIGGTVAGGNQVGIFIAYDDANGLMNFELDDPYIDALISDHISDAGGWTTANVQPTYTSADSPIFVMSLSDAGAALLTVGNKIKLVQTTTKYFIIHAKGTPSGGFTPITIYGGTGFTLANAAITGFCYSHDRTPAGFPMDPTGWTVTVTDTSLRTQATPTSGTWYNLGSVTISVPIGTWIARYTALPSADRAANGLLNLFITFSTANNTESDASMTRKLSVQNTTLIEVSQIAERILTVAAKTSYFLNTKQTAGVIANIYNDGSKQTTTIQLVDVYL